MVQTVTDVSSQLLVCRLERARVIASASIFSLLSVIGFGDRHGHVAVKLARIAIEFS
jgi:hypothetical protein